MACSRFGNFRLYETQPPLDITQHSSRSMIYGHVFNTVTFLTQYPIQPINHIWFRLVCCNSRCKSWAVSTRSCGSNSNADHFMLRSAGRIGSTSPLPFTSFKWCLPPSVFGTALIRLTIILHVSKLPSYAGYLQLHQYIVWRRFCYCWLWCWWCW